MSTTLWEQTVLSLAHEPLEQHGPQVSIQADERSLQRAYAHCARLTREHSKTFYLASGLLPKAKRRAMRALYAFCRVSDDLVDRADGDPSSALEAWRQRALGDPPRLDDPVALAWADTVARHRVPAQYAHQLIEGIGLDLHVKRYETFDQLAEYAYGVASTVGLMAMHIIGFRDRNAIRYAVKLGIALQLTNILRDVQEDWKNGRLYLPSEELAAFDLSEADIAAGRVNDHWRAFYRFQVERNRRLYAEAMPGIGLLHPGGRFAIAAASELYRAILNDIEAHDYDVFSRRAYVTDWGKLLRLPGIWLRASAYAPPVDLP